MQHRIGLVYVPGALPCFEGFGSLPTDLIQEDGLVKGTPASEVLDLLIIPGGSLVESKSITGKIKKEITRMADAGKFVLGICSGFQLLAKETDVGRLSSTPIITQGLGLLDVEFRPMICTDRVKATVVGKSFITDVLGDTVSGFHCHTYGNITSHSKARPILVSHVKRVNYRSKPQDFISGFTNKEGNVVGILTHGLLDENPTILQSIVKSLGISETELEEIHGANSQLLQNIKSEVGVSTGINSQIKPIISAKTPVVLFTTATGSGSGKTLIVTGLAGALKKRGINVGLLKVGGDIRDIVPALYLIKEPIRSFSSIKVANSGWMPMLEAVEKASKNYDLLMIEGAMGPFTGFLNENVKRPASTAEIAAALGAPTVLVVACDKAGVEGAIVTGLHYINVMNYLGIRTVGVILNKVHTSYLTAEIKERIKSAFSKVGVELLGILPRIQLEGRGAIPEIEIKYDEFGAKAIQLVEQSLDLDALARLAAPPVGSLLDYEAVLEKFKLLINNGCVLDVTKGETEQR
ncbi:MAG: cobyrinic acid a,c-diamide synthase [Candidatus Bathyarchaeum sp.]|nr:MAG: cobyrinic acid a,c-diamide synthase [Candidatus Bathyarchaeum sp.]